MFFAIIKRKKYIILRWTTIQISHNKNVLQQENKQYTKKVE